MAVRLQPYSPDRQAPPASRLILDAAVRSSGRFGDRLNPFRQPAGADRPFLKLADEVIARFRFRPVVASLTSCDATSIVCDR